MNCPVHGDVAGEQCAACWVTVESLSGDLPEPYRTLRDALDSIDGRWYRIQSQGVCAACGGDTRQRQMYCPPCATALLWELLRGEVLDAAS